VQLAPIANISRAAVTGSAGRLGANRFVPCVIVASRSVLGRAVRHGVPR
jgi:hypothetical protein